MDNGYIYYFIYFYCYYTAWNEGFSAYFSGEPKGRNGGFHGISGEHPVGLHEILVCRGSLHGEIGWRSFYFVLHLFIYLFIICLFIVCLCVYFLIIFKELVVGSWINYVV